MNKGKFENYIIKGCGGGIEVKYSSFISSEENKEDAIKLNNFLKRQIPFETRKELIRLIIQENLEKIIINN